MKKKPPKPLPVVQADERYEENAAYRRKVADEQRAKLEAAIAECGPDAESYGYWKIEDTTGVEPPRFMYCCRRPTHVGWQPSFHSDERVHDESRATVVLGVTYWPMRWRVSWSYIEEYNPKTAAEMKTAAEARRAKAIAKAEADKAAEPQLELPIDTKGTP